MTKMGYPMSTWSSRRPSEQYAKTRCNAYSYCISRSDIGSSLAYGYTQQRLAHAPARAWPGRPPAKVMHAADNGGGGCYATALCGQRLTLATELLWP
jgi:hypothetical protein